MMLKRSIIKHTVEALPALILTLGMTACSSDDSEPAPVHKPMPEEGVALTIPLSSTRGDNLSDMLDHLCIVAYDAGGHLIESIYKDGEFVHKNRSAFDAIDTNHPHGTVMSIMLPRDIYYDYTIDDRETHTHNGHFGIQFVAFYLPESNTKFGGNTAFEAPANLSELNSEIKDYYTLNFPATENGLFAPSDINQIPMSGALDLTTAICNYDPALWNVNHPMYLNNEPLMLIRSMAKVTIVDPQHFITGATFKTANHGALMPDAITADGKVTKATLPTKTESLEAFNTGFDMNQKIDGNLDEYVFYTFERDFTGKDADARERKLITLDWEGHPSQTFSFKNYSEDGDQSDPVWQGILRNHSYKFIIKKPADGNIHVDVKVEPFEKVDYDDTY